MSRKNGNRSMRGLALAAALLLIAAGAWADDLAQASFGAAGISFSPLVTNSGMTLTVAGHGYHARYTFGPGETPKLTTFDKSGNLLPDGTYKWELTARPSGAQIKGTSSQHGRGAPDGTESFAGAGPKLGKQSGSFTISGGAIVNPDLVEADAGAKPGQIRGGMTMEGDFSAGGTKNFAVPDPERPESTLYYAALEGPEAGTYYRGTARTVDGEVVIELPDYFAKVTEAEGLTVQLTSIGGWSRLYVASITPDRLVVRDAEGGEAEFSYLIQGVRLGYADYQVERPAAQTER